MGVHLVKVLAFDCSTVRGSLAVAENGTVIFAENFECPRGRGGAFFQVLDRAVKATGKPDRIAVGTGPGSYNGLRTAIATAEGLKLATRAELIGIASVRALPCFTPEYVAVNDARGGVFFYVRIRDREIIGEFELLSLHDLQQRLAAESEMPVLTSASASVISQARTAFPDASLLASLAIREEPGVDEIAPLYLKPAYITQPKRASSILRGQ